MSKRSRQNFAVSTVVAVFFFSLFCPVGGQILILKNRFASDAVTTLPAVQIM